MTVAPELVWLIERLRSTPSRRERLRLLLEGWRTVRSLSPADRLLVARELGFDGAEQLVEEIAQRRGTSVEEILGALRRDEESEAPRLGGLLRGLVDPKRRGSTIDRLLDAASAWVADLDTLRTEEQTAGDQLPPTPDLPDEDSEPDEGPADEPEAEVAVPPGLPPLTDKPGKIEVAMEAREEHVAEVGEALETVTEPDATEQFDLAAVEDTERPGDSKPFDAEQDLEVADELEADAPQPKVEEPIHIDAPEPIPLSPVRVVDTRAVVDELEATGSLLGRLGELARRLSELVGAGASELHGVVESFPEGWPRRRALEVLLRSGLPADLREALALVYRLDRPSERMWALTALAMTREFTARDEEALLAAADTPAIRRRLKLRLRQRA
jgi:hypothetical protein